MTQRLMYYDGKRPQAHVANLVVNTESSNVGIGTGFPGEKVDIVKSGTGIETQLALRNNDTTADNGVSLKFMGIDDATPTPNEVNYGGIRAKYTNHATGKSEIQILHRNDAGSLVQGLTLDHDGNLGIAKDSPSDRLHIDSSGASDFGITIGDVAGGGSDRVKLQYVPSSNACLLQNTSNPGGADVATLLFQTAGANNRMVITRDGNVGIGEDSPRETLEINGNTLISSETNGSTSSSNKLYFYGTTSSSVQNEQAYIRTSAYSLNTNGGDLEFWTSDTTSTLIQRMTINGAGNVGIGVVDPSFKLQIQDATDPTIRITDSTNNVHLDLRASDSSTLVRSTGEYPLLLNTNQKDRIKIHEGGDIGFYENTGGTETMYWDASNQKLGIGTTTPSFKLDIVDVDPLATVNIRSSAVINNGVGSRIIFGQTGDGIAQIEGKFNGGTSESNKDLVFYSGGNLGTPRMILNGNGRLGIGTLDPVETLSVHTDKPQTIANPDLSNIGGSYPIAQFMVSNVVSGANRGIILGGPSGGIADQPVYLQWNSGVPFQIVDPEGNYKVTVNTSNTGTIDFYSKTNDPVNDYVKSLYIGSTTYPIKSERFAGSSGCILFEGDSSVTGAPKVTFQDVNPSTPNQGVLGFNDNANTFSFSSGVNAGLNVINTHQDGTDDSVSLYFGLGRTGDTSIISTPAIKFGKENQWTGLSSSLAGYLSFSTRYTDLSVERMRITSYGTVLIGASDVKYQIVEGSKVADTSGTAVGVAFVDHTHSLTVNVIVKQATSIVASGIATITTAYGASTGGVTQQVQTGSGVTNIAVTYLNTDPSTGAARYWLEITPTYTGDPPTIYFTISGTSTSTMYLV